MQFYQDCFGEVLETGGPRFQPFRLNPESQPQGFERAMPGSWHEFMCVLAAEASNCEMPAGRAAAIKGQGLSRFWNSNRPVGAVWSW